MARVEDSYPTPIHGVSTLAPRNRARGQAGLQLNMRSDPVAKLTRRPSLSWGGFLLNTDKETVHHSYYRREKEFKLIVTDTGEVHGYVDGVSKTTDGDLSDYLSSTDLVMETINDTTFVVDRNVNTELLTNTDEGSIQKVSHVNVTSALNYSTDFVLTVKDQNNTVLGYATISIPDGVDNIEAADEDRATNAVAKEIARQVTDGSNASVAITNSNYAPTSDCYEEYNYTLENDGHYSRDENLSYDPNNTICKPYITPTAGITGVTAIASGSSVAIYRTDNSDWLTLEVEAGRSDNAIAVNKVVETVEGLPLYAIPGTRITVKPDPTDTDGTYYLDAITLDGLLTGNIQEVVWTETRSPIEPFAFDITTMPHTIRYVYDTDTFIVGSSEVSWEERQAGDNESCPPPEFVGRTVTALGQFQKRLVLISDNDVSMSKTDNLYDWWKQSAVNLLVTDPIGVTSNSTGIDILQYIVEHNRDLLIVASNGQFKIEGVAGITPQTVAMPLTTTQEIQVSVPPVPMGSAIYLPLNYGDSTGVTKYDGKRDSQDLATPITHHVIGYMRGQAKILVGSPNLEMLAMTTTGSLQNEIFIYEQFSQGDQVSQQSWSTWTLPEDNKILAMNFRRDRLTVTVQVGLNIYQKSFNMYSRVATNTSEVFLDDFLELSTDGLTATLPTDYNETPFVVVMGADTIYPLAEIPYTKVGQVITFSEDINAGTVYIGTPFRSAYKPTRPFKEDSKGIATTTDRLRVGKFILNVVNTERVLMHIDSKYYSGTDQEQSPRILNRASNRIGVVDLFTGDYRYSFSQDVDYAEAEFYTEGYLGMTIAGISWEGQYNKSSGRMS